MQAPKPFKPLLEVGAEYIREVVGDAADPRVPQLENILSVFIDKAITYEVAAANFQTILGSTHPLDRISRILSLLNSPPIQGSDHSLHISSSGSEDSATAPKRKMRNWTEIEDQRLLAAIHKYGLDNWAAVSSFVGNNRGRAQCSQRWFRGLDPRIQKVIWTEEEENKLLQLIATYGDHSWTKVASKLGNRSDAQCRYHYKQILKEKNGVKLRKNRVAKKIPQISSAPPGLFMKTQGLSNSSEALPPITSLLQEISRPSGLKEANSFMSPLMMPAGARVDIEPNSIHIGRFELGGSGDVPK